MTETRLILALAPVALLAACGGDATDDERAASGEVLEGSISDAMLPLDRVRSEPPLEDPEAFAEVQEEAAEDAAQQPGGGGAESADTAENAAADEGAAEPEPEPEPEG